MGSCAHLVKISAEVGPGRPCIRALMDHGSGGRLYFLRIALVQMVYLSSVSRSRPSMSKRQARTGGKLLRGQLSVN